MKKRTKAKRKVTRVYRHKPTVAVSFLKWVFAFVGLAIVLVVFQVLYVYLQSYFFILGSETVR
ncbi:hypothetical protein A2773_04620 [Candidatus Gottesmanbacteria bacterium RIFCSPHIGHO2_01_FULL_39_10]|uniref:Uncharacterized protein n=1 Tax=Candidatus Gottesmanbacteria bacterium RIFCSPHIGHO2_01_FULL_39_10 TaxID=1798375 RepID=A0A1F5ZRL5_9BACT|nr:MAG: hypothetical protein A2773_04620 [Candidatus Gottesmanbacteria bacterium RIFCSPHIGHO2_01_FULL_39_10]